MRPWNFHAYHDIDWKKHYHPIEYYTWRRLSNQVRHLLHPTQSMFIYQGETPPPGFFI